jgi:aromatic ring-opening dioxygenase LigB subunit
MLITAAVCPHPPVLVSEVAAGAAGELDELRAACRAAIGGLRAADRLLIVGAGDETRSHPAGAGGSLASYGVDLSIGDGPPVLPLSLTVGRWLLGRAPDGFQAVAADDPPENCRELGGSLAAGGDRLALLVMGDGSARRDEKAPGYVDLRAEAYDAAIARALADADGAALAALDPTEAAELLVAGRAAWQVLAAAAQGAGLTGRLVADEAPYGVGYFVAAWS